MPVKGTLKHVGIHVRANPGDIARACLLPGDPRRAARIAERYLDGARLVHDVRGALCFTGAYRGTPVTVQATGMGGPSAAIYVSELCDLGAERLVRVGTCGGLAAGVELGDLVIATAATPATGTVGALTRGAAHAPVADFGLTSALAAAAGPGARVGAVVTADLFYEADSERAAGWAALGHLAVEMEAATVFTVAALRGARAGACLVVTDVHMDGRLLRIDDDALERAVDRMAEVALTAITRSAIVPYRVENWPAERVATHPPTVEQYIDEGKWPHVSPARLRSRSRSSPIVPAPTCTVRLRSSIDRIPRRRLRSTTTLPGRSGVMPPQTPLPAPKAMTGVAVPDAVARHPATSDVSAGRTTAPGDGHS